MNVYDRLVEAKDKFILKNEHLTSEQKKEIINFFSGHRNYENEIDWNTSYLLNYADFKKVMDKAANSNTQLKKQKKAGGRGIGFNRLIEGKDYKILEATDQYTLYQPLTHLGSCVIASDEVEPKTVNDIPFWVDEDNEWMERSTRKQGPFGIVDVASGAHWCISMFKTSRHWDEYTECGNLYYMLCNYDEDLSDRLKKLCIQYNPSTDEILIFDGNDDDADGIRELQEFLPYLPELVNKYIVKEWVPATPEQVQAIDDYLAKCLETAKNLSHEVSHDEIAEKTDGTRGFYCDFVEGELHRMFADFEIDAGVSSHEKSFSDLLVHAPRPSIEMSWGGLHRLGGPAEVKDICDIIYKEKAKPLRKTDAGIKTTVSEWEFRIHISFNSFEDLLNSPALEVFREISLALRAEYMHLRKGNGDQVKTLMDELAGVASKIYGLTLEVDGKNNLSFAGSIGDFNVDVGISNYVGSLRLHVFFTILFPEGNMKLKKDLERILFLLMPPKLKAVGTWNNCKWGDLAFKSGKGISFEISYRDMDGVKEAISYIPKVLSGLKYIVYNQD